MKLSARSLKKMEENADAAEQLLKSLANANRLKVLCQLTKVALTIAATAMPTAMPAAISHRVWPMRSRRAW